MTAFRMELMRTLMPAPRLHDLTELFGTHYEATSCFMRALGARVGRHVYWPGTGPSTQDYDLIDIGDNVVFGSRSHIVTSDGTGSEVVRVGANSMVADRVVLLPGSTLTEKVVFGSGALARRATSYACGTTWVGSKGNGAISLTKTAEQEKYPLSSDSAFLTPPATPWNFSSHNSSDTTLAAHMPTASPSLSDLQKTMRPELSSRAVSTDAMLQSSNIAASTGSAETASPFGRAFYHKLAPYRVWTQFEIFLYSTFTTVLTAVFWNIGSVACVQIVSRIYKDNSFLAQGLISHTASQRPVALYFLFWMLIVAIMAVQSLCVLLFLIGAKWVLMGRRMPGNYDWDKSPYCQRWQLFLKLEALRRDCYGGNGILGMLTGTHWIVLYFRAMGAKIGRDCALFAGGQPSLLFTEPDLLTLGDRVSVDDASLVGHINTAGRFSLNPLHVGDRSVLRSGSRLLSGGSCQEDTCLLEHTLVMAGDVVDAGCTMQGWPSEEFTGNRMPTLQPKQVWASI